LTGSGACGFGSYATTGDAALYGAEKAIAEVRGLIKNNANVTNTIDFKQARSMQEAVSATGCEESDFVVMLFIAWSPIRRSNAG
jgi:hypothetical protein